MARAWIDGDETAKEMLARLLTERPFLFLPPLHRVPLRVGNVVEIVGPSPSAKTEVLIQVYSSSSIFSRNDVLDESKPIFPLKKAAINCILPREWNGVHYGGLERLTMYFDLDCRFDVLRLSQSLKLRIMELHGPTTNIHVEPGGSGYKYDNSMALRNGSDDELFRSCMRRFSYIRCYNSFEFLAALKAGISSTWDQNFKVIGGEEGYCPKLAVCLILTSYKKPVATNRSSERDGCSMHFQFIWGRITMKPTRNCAQGPAAKLHGRIMKPKGPLEKPSCLGALSVEEHRSYYINMFDAELYALISSVNAFYWVDRAYKPLQSGGDCRSNLSLQSVIETVIQEIRKLLQLHAAVVLVTKADIFGAGPVTSELKRSYNLAWTQQLYISAVAADGSLLPV
ncbi:hypothetical protein ACLOJK_001147 [Asimina triloba]